MRKVEIVVISGDPNTNRDHGKRFKITEMPAIRAEKWAMRVLLALASTGAQLPEDYKSAGMAGLAVAGFQALQSLNWGDAEPLLDEMMECVRILPDPRNIEVERPLILNRGDGSGDDVEEVSTLLTLRRKIFEIHTSFFSIGAASKTA